MIDENKIEVRYSCSGPFFKDLCSLANFAHGSLGRSHDRSLGFPVQHFLVEYLDSDRWEASNPTLHIVSVVVSAVMHP
jgi:hypothetical protein